MDVDPRIQNARPGWALFVLASPVVVAAIVAALYVGMWWLGMSGRPPGGDTVQFEVIGCDDAATVLAARLADMGLGATILPTPGGFVLTTTFTGRPEVDERLDEVLSQPGRFELRNGTALLTDNAGVTEATYRLDGVMDMWLLLRLTEPAGQTVATAVRAEPRGRMTFLLDGQAIAMQPNTRDVMVGEVEGIPLADMDRPSRMHWVAEWSVLIDHPLSCPVQVRALPGS
jgi:hypothetical protein